MTICGRVSVLLALLVDSTQVVWNSYCNDGTFKEHYSSSFDALL